MTDTPEVATKKSAAPPEKNTRVALTVILVTVMLDVLAAGVAVPVLPDFIKSMSDGTTATTALVLGAYGTAFALAQFLASPLQAGFSDGLGRRPVILTSNFGLAVSYLVMVIAPNIAVLIIAQLLAGFLSGSAAAAYAYAADITPPQRRAVAFGQLGAAAAVGAILAPALGGMLGTVNLRAPFLLAGVLSLSNGLAAAVFLRESLAPSARQPMAWRIINPLSAAADVMRMNPAVLLWLSAIFTAALGGVAVTSVLVLYLRDIAGLSLTQVGILLTAYGVGAVISQALLVGHALRYLGERTTIVGSYLLQITAFLVLVFVPNITGLWVVVALLAVSGVGGPSQIAAISRCVPQAAQARLQGAVRGLSLLAGIVGPGVFTGIFAVLIASSKAKFAVGAPFLLGAALGGVGMLFAAAALANMGRSAPAPDPVAAE